MDLACTILPEAKESPAAAAAAAAVLPRDFRRAESRRTTIGPDPGLLF